MRVIRFLAMLTLLSFALPASSKACVFLPVPQQTAAEQRKWSHTHTQYRMGEAARRLSAGQVRIATELAEMLVPNIRPILLRRTDCGPEGEIDAAGGYYDILQYILHDARLTDIDLSYHRGTIRNFDGEAILGPSCNAEFRGQFAAWLEGALSTADLRAAWLFLTARKRTKASFERLVTFDRDTRHPPIRWWGADQWINADIDRFITRNRVGKRLGRSIATFWAQQSGRLGSDDAVCPKAVVSLQADRERLINAILQEHAARLLRRRKSPSAPNE